MMGANNILKHHINRNRIPIDERKCLTCNKLEDEFHFLLECSVYNDLRNQYIKGIIGKDLIY